MPHAIISDVIKGQDVVFLSPGASAREAADRMAAKDTAAVVVLDGKRLLGIVTERDLTRRVLAAGKDAQATPLEAIMTRDPDTLSPTDSALDALELMRARRYRHVPVVDAGKVVGMVSIRDLYDAVKARLEADVLDTAAFSFGDE